MSKVVKLEKELYPVMCDWLRNYLKDKYLNEEIIVEDTSQINLDVILEKYGVIKDYPATVGIGMQIDVLGIVKKKSKSLLFFIEAKKTQLNTHDLGQILIYSRICNPEQAFLLSSSGLGQLEKLIKNREDIAYYSLEKKIKMIQIGKWDVLRNMPDVTSIIPKIL